MNLDDENTIVCQQCASLRETLSGCEGGCGREICAYCGPLCRDCKDKQAYDRHRREEDRDAHKTEEQRVFEAQVARAKKEMGGRGISGAVWDAMDYVFGFADDALAKDLECWEGDYDSYTSEEIREMLRIRWHALPEWKKALYKVKKKVERATVRTGMKGAALVGKLGKKWIRFERKFEE